jgi:ubiquinone/menaquinone biosynthesis C-methylase UbiE/uncharacterized protein YbaR (Trm112 family)
VIEARVLQILKCPASGLDLSVVSDEVLKELNQRIEDGDYCHIDHSPVQMRLEGALISSDGRFIYPIVDGILILLPHLAITKRGDSITKHLSSETENVRRFYDEVGWQFTTHEGIFEDSNRFEDLRPVSRIYIQRSHKRVGRHLPASGSFLLDVASGPIPHSDYLSYSEAYDRRICIDISIVALRSAKTRIGSKGVFIQGDITQLPLKTDSVDGFVSLHTIYHVSGDSQVKAFRELERVVKPQGAGVVVYTWGWHCRLMSVLTAGSIPRALRLIAGGLMPKTLLAYLKSRVRSRTAETSALDGSELYFHPHDYSWFNHEVASHANWEIRVWRSVSLAFLQKYVHPRLCGGTFLSVVFWLENVFPRLSGRLGQYPMMIFRKG